MSSSHLDQIMIRLRIISLVEENGRIRVASGDKASVEHDSFLQGLRRLWNGDSRSKALEFIRSAVENAIEKATDIMNSQFMNIYDFHSNPSSYEINKFNEACADIRNLSKAMNNSIKGIEHLKVTYAGDANIISNLENIICKIQTYVVQMEQKLESSRVNYNNYQTNYQNNNYSQENILNNNILNIEDEILN